MKKQQMVACFIFGLSEFKQLPFPLFEPEEMELHGSHPQDYLGALTLCGHQSLMAYQFDTWVAKDLDVATVRDDH
jgi:hypothetical protein